GRRGHGRGPAPVRNVAPVGGGLDRGRRARLRRLHRRPARHARGDDRRARGASTLDPSAEAALELQLNLRPADAFGDLRVAPTMAARPDPMRFQNVAIPATATPSAPERTQHQEWDALADRVAAPPFLRPGW